MRRPILLGYTMIGILRSGSRCEKCVYARTVVNKVGDVPKRVYCPFSGCIYNKEEKQRDREQDGNRSR